MFNSDKLNQFLFKNRLFICVSLGIEKKVKRQFPFLNVKTIYNFVDFKKNAESEQQSDKYILSIARMDHENVKQLDVLLECYAKSMLPAKEIRLSYFG